MRDLKLICAISALTLVGLAASRASADTIFNIDQNNSGSPTQTGAAIIGSSGDIWNGIAGTSTASLSLEDTTGSTLAGVTFIGSSGASSYTSLGGSAMDTATTPLMEDYEYGAGSGGPLTQTISGLTNFVGETFTLYIFAAGNAAGQGSLITLGGSGISDAGATASTLGTNRMLSAGVGDAYQVFTGTITGPSFTITEAKGQDGYFNGLQLDLAAAPEPSAYVMFLGGLGILFVLVRIHRPTFS